MSSTLTNRIFKSYKEAGSSYGAKVQEDGMAVLPAMQFWPSDSSAVAECLHREKTKLADLLKDAWLKSKFIDRLEKEINNV